VRRWAVRVSAACGWLDRVDAGILDSYLYAQDESRQDPASLTILRTAPIAWVGGFCSLLLVTLALLRQDSPLAVDRSPDPSPALPPSAADDSVTASSPAAPALRVAPMDQRVRVAPLESGPVVASSGSVAPTPSPKVAAAPPAQALRPRPEAMPAPSRPSTAAPPPVASSSAPPRAHSDLVDPWNLDDLTFKRRSKSEAPPPAPVESAPETPVTRDRIPPPEGPLEVEQATEFLRAAIEKLAHRAVVVVLEPSHAVPPSSARSELVAATIRVDGRRWTIELELYPAALELRVRDGSSEWRRHMATLSASASASGIEQSLLDRYRWSERHDAYQAR